MTINKLLILLTMILLWSPGGEAKNLPLQPIKINSASKQELLLLPGIGEKKADEIMAYRAQKPIQGESDLMAVKGIGEKTISNWKGFIDYSMSFEEKIPADKNTKK